MRDAQQPPRMLMLLLAIFRRAAMTALPACAMMPPHVAIRACAIRYTIDDAPLFSLLFPMLLTLLRHIYSPDFAAATYADKRCYAALRTELTIYFSPQVTEFTLRRRYFFMIRHALFFSLMFQPCRERRAGAL